MLSPGFQQKALVFFVLGLVLLGVVYPAIAEEARYVPGEVLIKFKETATEAQRNGVLREMGATKIKDFDFIGVSHQRLNGLTVEEALSRFKGHPHILFIEPNIYCERDVIPNDPIFPEQWQLHNTLGDPYPPNVDIRAANAWDVFRGSDEIIVGIIDSPIDVNHPDLVDNLYRNYGEIPLNGIDDDNNGWVDDYFGFGYQGQDTAEGGLHGTAVSSVVGAKPNNGIGIAGVCWDVRILQLAEDRSITEITARIDYAISCNAHILNMSFGTNIEAYIETLRLACQRADDAGIYMVCSAGNDDKDIDDPDNDPHYPASYDIDNIIAVTSTGRFDNQTYNYGAVSVDLAAPYTAEVCIPGGEYDMVAGTSLSSPTVAGVLALMMGKFGPDSGMDFKARLLETVDHLESLEGKCVSGGRVNAFLAIADPDYMAPATIRNVTIKEIASNWIELEWTATGDDGGAGTASEYEFRYSTKPIRNIRQFEMATPIESVPYPQPAGSIETFVIDGLEQGTTYYIAFRVFDEWGSYYYRLGEDYTNNVSGIKKIKGFTTLGPPAIAIVPSTLVADPEKWNLNRFTFEIENNGVGTLDYEILTPEEYWWITCSPAAGSIESSDSETVAIYIRADDLPCGENTAYVEIASNDYSNPLVTLPLELTVSGEAKLAVEPASIDFGPVIVGQADTEYVYVTNRGCETLQLLNMSCDHLDYWVDRLILIPPDTTFLSIVTFAPSSYGEIDGNLNLVVEGNYGPVITKIPLSGEGVTPPEIVIVPEELSTPTLYTGAIHHEALTIYNTGGYQLDVTLGEGGIPEWVSLSTSVGSIAPGDSLVVDVVFRSLGYCQDQAGVLSINSNDPDTPVINVPLSMTVLPESHIASSEGLLDWGDVYTIIKPIKKTFQVMNLGCDGHVLTVSNIVSSVPNVFSVVTATPFTVNPGESHDVAVTLLVGVDPGIYQSILTIYSDDPDRPESYIELWVNVLEGMLQASGGTEEAPIVDSAGPAPLDLRACPNPFNPNTEIRFNLDRPGRIELRIYDVRGALINAIDNGHCASGPVTVPWNGSNRRGSKVASGIYFYCLMLDGNQLGATKKMILLR